MVKRLILLLILPLVLFGETLTLNKGIINAHTEVFGDSSIDPSVSNLTTTLTMNGDDITTLKGDIRFNLKDFISSNSGRDEHMLEMFESDKFSTVSLTIHKVTKEEDNYIFNTTLHMHGINNIINITSTIKQEADKVNIDALFSVKVSDYGMQAPSMLFFTVRDRVDINTSISFRKEK